MEPLGIHLAVILHQPELRDAMVAEAESQRRPSRSLHIRGRVSQVLRAAAARIEPRPADFSASVPEPRQTATAQ